MAMLVRPSITFARASWISRSVWESMFAVASSRIRIFGLKATALAKAKSCLWPTERVAPRSPSSVSYPAGSSLMN